MRDICLGFGWRPNNENDHAKPVQDDHHSSYPPNYVPREYQPIGYRYTYDTQLDINQYAFSTENAKNGYLILIFVEYAVAATVTLVMEILFSPSLTHYLVTNTKMTYIYTAPIIYLSIKVTNNH